MKEARQTDEDHRTLALWAADGADSFPSIEIAAPENTKCASARWMLVKWRPF